jgi:DNA-binding MarR family transcriptional regulator
MKAKDICDRARLHKTKVSRAVKALEARRYLTRRELPQDRRNEVLSLTRTGQVLYQDLSISARDYDAVLVRALSAEENRVLRGCLKKLAGF